MKQFFAATLLALALIAGPVSAAEIGKPAPDHSFTDINGNAHKLSAFKGKTVVLEWTNPECPFVKKFYEAKEMQRVQAEALKDSNVVWFTINSGATGKQGHLDQEAAKKYVTEHGVNSTAYVVDTTGAFGKLYGAKTTPHMFVIDKDGVLVYQGAIDSIKSFDQEDIAKADNYVLKALTALKDSKKIEHSSTEPYGCGVKYAD